MPPSLPTSTRPHPLRHFDVTRFLSRIRQALVSNASVVGAVVVLVGLFLTQAVVADWLTDDEIIDEDDIVAPLTATAAAGNTDSCDPWVVAFADEFEADSLDQDAWIAYNSPAGNGNGTRRPEAVEVVGGNLVITARMVDGTLVLGGLASNHQQTFGRIMVRARIELDPSESIVGRITTWPAGNDHPDGGAIALFHAPATVAGEPFYSYVDLTDGRREEITHQTNAQDWHELAVEWRPRQVVVFRDGERVGSTSNPDAIPDQPHVATIQLEATEPVMQEARYSVVRLFVDWIRFYQANDPGPSC